MNLWLPLIVSAGILGWAVERYFRSGILQAFVTASTTNQAFAVSTALLPLLLVIAWNARKPHPRQNAVETRLLIAVIALLGGFGAYLVFDSSNKTAAVAAIAAVAATIGWVIQRQIAVEISRKQHTLSIVLQMRQSELFNKHRTNLFANFPDGVSITEADVAGLLNARKIKENYKLGEDGVHKFPPIESIYFICNFNEFLAAAVKQGDIDGDLLNESMGSLVKNVYKKCEPLLRADMAIVDGKPTAKTWENYSWLVNKHWSLRS